MRHKVTHYSSIVVLVGIVALSMVRAQARTASKLEEFSTAVFTLSVGQTLRISVVNPLPAAATGADGRGFKMLFAATILDADGRVIARGNEVALDPGEFHSFNFNRADLPAAGEAGTGRLQLRSQVRRRFLPGYPTGVRVGSVDRDHFVDLVDNLTGQTQAAALLPKNVALDSSSEQYQAQPSLLGLAYGQTLRVSVSHPNGGRNRQLLRGRITLQDASGNLIAQSSELVIPPGEFRSYDFPRSALPLAGELNGRVQMAVNVFLKFDQRESRSVSVTLELVDQSTGRTSWMLLPAILKVRDIPSCRAC